MPQAAAISSDKFLRAILLIQRWWRRYRARLELKRRTAWIIYQSINFASESAHAQLLSFYNEMLRISSDGSSAHTVQASKSPNMHFYQRLQQFGEKEDKALLADSGFNDIVVERDYLGVHLKFPLNITDVHLLIDSFKSGQFLHAKYLIQLLHESRLVLKTRPNIHQVSTSISKQITIVGDIHGYLFDLLIIFDKNGLPDVTNPYIFNGDFVDRGKHSVEVLSLLCACQLVWPTAVFLNRGNHEDSYINTIFGLNAEVHSKYKQYSTRILKLLKDFYAWLPLAAIIDNRIFVTHGGISHRLDLKLVRKLNRHRFVSPSELTWNPKPLINQSELLQIMDLLWNDPQSKPGYRFNEPRKVGLFFGPDVTSDFLKRHRLNMVVRSHDAKPEGFEYCHNSSVLTVFSASNYISDNMGAYVKFNRKRKPHIVQFTCKSVAPRSLGKRVNNLEENALRALRGLITGAKVDLLKAFELLDPNRTGVVSMEQWYKAMSSTLQLNLPWRLLRPHVVQLNSQGKVMYMTSFDQVTIMYKKKDISPATEILYRYKDQLEAAFRIMDINGSGYISLNDFKECCAEVYRATGRKTLTDEEKTEISKLVDLNNDGKIDFNEFLEAFRIADLKRK